MTMPGQPLARLGRRTVRGARLAAVVLVVCSLFSAAGVAAASVQPKVSASLAHAPCSSSELREVTSTNLASYGPGSLVKMTVSITNISSVTCSITVGPTSPSFGVTNSKGSEIWNNCFADDRPGACAMYLAVRSLKPRTAFTETFTWDQRIGVARVPVGVYQLTVRADGISTSQAVKFVIAASAPRTLTLTQAASGHRYSLRVGDRLVVKFSGPSSYSWTLPASSNQAVLLRRSGSSGSATTGTFVATAQGTSRVTAIDNPKCYPQCASPSRLFTATVAVTG